MNISTNQQKDINKSQEKIAIEWLHQFKETMDSCIEDAKDTCFYVTQALEDLMLGKVSIEETIDELEGRGKYHSLDEFAQTYEDIIDEIKENLNQILAKGEEESLSTVLG